MRFIKFQRLVILMILTVVSLTMIVSGCRKKTTAQAVAGGNGNGSGHNEIQWLTDWEKARQTAQAEGKDLLIDFAGSDWCYWCKKLDSEVFSKSEFVESAQDDFVFVLIDFPNDKSGQSEALQQQNEQLSQEFGVTGFPTVVLAHPNGEPYAKTGYKEGGPKVYLEHLGKLQDKASP